MSLGLTLVLVTLFGCLSNWLNWRYLNSRILHLLYYIGAFVHEGSHALLCLLVGARIHEFKVFSPEPHVTHGEPRLPIIGKVLISSAPLFGGLIFLFLVNHYLLGDSFVLAPHIGNWDDSFMGALQILEQIRLFEWQSWVMLLLFLNVGAMIGPSVQDMRNIWPAVILLFFISPPLLVDISLVALSMIFVNILIQTALIVSLKIFTIKMPTRRESGATHE